MYGSTQFAGNMEEYFSKHTKKLVVYIINSGEKDYNLIRLYNNGNVVREEKVWTSKRKILYYASWYIFQIYALLKYFHKNELVIAICGHPLCFVGMNVLKLFRRITFVYMNGDYFPGINFLYKAFHALKLYYHKRIPYAFYLSDPVNKIMNGSVLNSKTRKTIMWGVKPKIIQRKLSLVKKTLLFVGLIKDGQGLELALQFLGQHPVYKLKIIGICHPGWYEKVCELIKFYGVEKQVYYPNRFFSDEELLKESRDCFVGIAPYTTEITNASYYADPGKVKAYAEMGLPVIITNTTAIAPYVKKFHSGEVIIRNAGSFYSATLKISKNYNRYLRGVKLFNSFFYYEKYYAKKFSFLEHIYEAT